MLWPVTIWPLFLGSSEALRPLNQLLTKVLTSVRGTEQDTSPNVELPPCGQQSPPPRIGIRIGWIHLGNKKTSRVHLMGLD